MQWFTAWWQSMGTLSQVLACAAIPATLILLLQTALLLVSGGLGDGGDTDGAAAADAGHDAGGDESDPADAGAELRLITVRGLVAFFAIGGWAGIVAAEAGLPAILAILIAAVSGALALILAAYIIKWALSMQDNGNLDLSNAAGRTATVYIPIPAARGGTGRVTMLLQDRFAELEAVTDGARGLKTGETVLVTGTDGVDRLVVSPVMAEQTDDSNQ